MNTNRQNLFRSIMGIITGATLFMANPVFAAPGDLDVGFGTNGVVITDVVNASSDNIEAMAIQADGKIVVAGYTFNPLTTNRRYALARYNINGSLDTSFDSNGTMTLALSSISDSAKDMVIQPDGKILILGSSWSVASGNSSEDVALLRFNSNGTPDLTFDSDGSVFTDINMSITQGSTVSADTPSRMALQPDGKILVSAQTRVTGDDIAILRYNSDGSLDTTFDHDGILRYNLNPVLAISDYARAIAVQPDGKIVVAGEWWTTSGASNKNPFVTRLDSSGQVDTEFGIDGVTESLSIRIGDDVKDVLIQPDGKILVAGFVRDSVSNTTGANFMLIRFNTNGSMDTTFNGGGYVVTDANNFSRDQGYSVVLQPDGKILLGGYSDGADMLLRYNSDGSLDTSFGNNGMVSSGVFTWAFATAIQPDGKIINAGYNFDGTHTQFALARFEGDSLDIQPDAFTFTDETGINTNDPVTSELITVSGLSTGVTVPVTISGGEYALNGATVYQTNIGYVQNGDQINVRHTAAATTGDSVNTTLSVGGLHAPDNTSLVLGDVTSDIFTSTTGTSSNTTNTTTTTSTGGSSSGSMSGLMLLSTCLLLAWRRRYSTMLNS